MRNLICIKYGQFLLVLNHVSKVFLHLLNNVGWLYSDMESGKLDFRGIDQIVKGVKTPFAFSIRSMPQGLFHRVQCPGDVRDDLNGMLVTEAVIPITELNPTHLLYYSRVK